MKHEYHVALGRSVQATSLLAVLLVAAIVSHALATTSLEASSTIAYIDDDAVQKEMNAEGANYWERYIEEIGGLLGIRPGKMSLKSLEKAENLKDISTLLVGAQSGARLSKSAKENIREWVESGGALIGFAVDGLDDVFGIEVVETIGQEPCDHSICGYCGLKPHPLANSVYSFPYAEHGIPIFSDIRKAVAKGCDTIADLHDENDKLTQYVAVGWRTHGKGRAGYFAFDVPKTVWLMHQGRALADKVGPIVKAKKMQVLGKHTRKVPYADQLCFLVQNMIAQKPMPFIFQIPPKGDLVPDALLYWTGDEYTGPVKMSLKSSDWMREQGLAYHINIQSFEHPITREQFDHITKINGHEIGIFFTLHEQDNHQMAPELYKRQNEEYRRRFGRLPVTSLNYHCHWTGWAQPARWIAAAGCKADGTFIGYSTTPESHSNGPQWGFGFGTSFPYYYYDGFEGENKRIDLMEQPCVCYETGHRASTTGIPSRLKHEGLDADVGEVHQPLHMAIKHHLVMNMFYHPTYIVKYPRCRQAILEVLRYIEFRKAVVVHMGNDALAEWWNARRESRVAGRSTNLDKMVFQCECRYKDGMIVKVFLPHQYSPKSITCDGRPATYKTEKSFGGKWLYVIVPSGSHQVEIRRKAA